MKITRTLSFLVLMVGLSLSTAEAQKFETYQVFKNSDGILFVHWPGNGPFDAKPVGPKSCSLEDCQEWIKENWTDMRPLSLRKRPGRAK